jgi:hypothetical protein
VWIIPAGLGCAFHVAALRRDEDPMDWKLRICWQVPLFFDIDDDTRTAIVRLCRTVDWGGEGVLDWWCIGHPDAFNAGQPLWVTMGAELGRVCGAAVYGGVDGLLLGAPGRRASWADAALDDPLAPAVSALDRRSVATWRLP